MGPPARFIRLSIWCERETESRQIYGLLIANRLDSTTTPPYGRIHRQEARHAERDSDHRRRCPRDRYRADLGLSRAFGSEVSPAALLHARRSQPTVLGARR